MFSRISFVYAALMVIGCQLFAQSAPPGTDRQNDPSSFVGMRLEEVFARFGLPRTVYAARGGESWQDDVVFVYGEGDFYIFRDRVWQVGITSIFGIKIGDAKAAAVLALGERARDEGNHLLLDIAGYGWPLSLRVNFDAGRISAMYIYRPDY